MDEENNPLSKAVASLTSERDHLMARLNEATARIAELEQKLSETSRQSDLLVTQVEPVGHRDKRVQDELLFLLRRLEPKGVEGHDKVRIGAAHDGGYVALNDFFGIDAVYSFGVGFDVSFDKHFAELGIPVFQYDHTIDALPIEHPNFHWRKLGLSSDGASNKTFVTLPTVFAQNNHLNSNELIMKMDIEDAEWDVIGCLDVSLLQKFRQIVIELHCLERAGVEERFHRMLRAISALTVHHNVVHVHGNNFAPWTVVGGIALPTVIELTLVRKAGKIFKASNETFPSPFDSPNNPEFCDYRLGGFRF